MQHLGQAGVSAFSKRKRCFASGACPVLSWKRMAACFLGSLVMSFRYEADGRAGSMAAMVQVT